MQLTRDLHRHQEERAKRRVDIYQPLEVWDPYEAELLAQPAASNKASAKFGSTASDVIRRFPLWVKSGILELLKTRSALPPKADKPELQLNVAIGP